MPRSLRLRSDVWARVARSFDPTNPWADEDGYVGRVDGAVVHADDDGRRYVIVGGAAGERLREYLDPEIVRCAECGDEIGDVTPRLCVVCAEEMRAIEDPADWCPPRE